MRPLFECLLQLQFYYAIPLTTLKSLFCECVWHNRRVLQRVEPVAVCDQFSLLVFSQLKHKIRWEAFNVTPYLLVQTLCLHPVQHGNVTVNHDLMTTETTNKTLDVGLDAAVPRLGRVKIFPAPMLRFPDPQYLG